MRRVVLLPVVLLAVVLLAAACSSVDATPRAAPQTAVAGDFACPDPLAEPTPGAPTVPEGAVAARLCPRSEVIAYDEPPQPNMVAPVDALTTGVDELVDAVNALPLVEDDTETRMCPGAGGINYLLELQYAEGSLRTLTATLGGCEGVRVGDGERIGAASILEKFADLLLRQRSSMPPPAVRVDLACPDDDSGYVIQTPVVVRPEDLTHAVLCTHEKYGKPFLPPVPLDRSRVALLARDLSRPGSPTDDAPEELFSCPESLTTVVVGQTTWGDVFQLDRFCAFLIHEGWGSRVWRMSPQTAATIDALVARALRP